MAGRNPERSGNGLKEKIASIIKKSVEFANNQQRDRPFFPPPGLSQSIEHSNNPPPTQPAHTESDTSITEPLDTASIAISATKSISPANVEASAILTESPMQPAHTESDTSITEPLDTASAAISAVKSISSANVEASAIPTEPPTQPAHTESDTSTTEPLDTASIAISAAKSISPANVEASAIPTKPASPLIISNSPPLQKPSPKRPHKSCEGVHPFQISFDPLPSSESTPSQNPRRLAKAQRIEAPPPSPESPPSSHPRRLGKSHRIEVPSPSPRIKSTLLRHLTSGPLNDDELKILVEMDLLSDHLDAQNRFNETADLLQSVKLSEKSPESPPPPYTLDAGSTEPSESEQVAKPEKEEKCIVCERFERLSLLKDEVNFKWTCCQFYLNSHMHNICTWKPDPEATQSKFWLSLEYQQSRQNFDAEVTRCLDEIDLQGLATAVTLHIDRFLQVLYNHTPLDQLPLEEKCEINLKELQTEYLKLMTTRDDILRYLLYEKEGFKHAQCPSYKKAIEWIKECTLKISDGLREFETNLEHLYKGRLIWTNTETQSS